MSDSVAMTDERFWNLISRTTALEADSERQLEALREVLQELSAPELEAFQLAFQRQQKRAYTWDLWGAAYILNGHASDGGFEYFQRWLISKGQKIFEVAVADPDALGVMVAPTAAGTRDFEAIAYVAGRVWAEKTGIDPWKDPSAKFPYTGMPPAEEPAGTPFNDEPASLSKRYPKLWAKFGADP
jgi:hypothetical protein